LPAKKFAQIDRQSRNVELISGHNEGHAGCDESGSAIRRQAVSRIDHDAGKLAFDRSDLLRYLSGRVVAWVHIYGEEAGLLDYRACEKVIPSPDEIGQAFGTAPLLQSQVGVQDVGEIPLKLNCKVLSWWSCFGCV